MYENFGAVPNHEKRSVEFKLFFPDNSQYSRGGSPQIKKIQVTGDFQKSAGLGNNWQIDTAPEMKKGSHPNGLLYTYKIDKLPENFYQYKYFVTFKDNSTRWCTDPCTKYAGSENENAGFVIGGPRMQTKSIKSRKPLNELIIYEMMIDDFTAQIRNNLAPIAAVRENLNRITKLGINAIEFLPWTAWPGNNFNWGYEPTLFFAVEYKYTNGPDPTDKLFQLKKLINALHQKNIQVIMDGVFNHVTATQIPGRGFGYHWLYQNPEDSPFTGHFVESFSGLVDIDFNNFCTQQFMLDVCKYWIDEFKIDGIRFDYSKGFYESGTSIKGIEKLVKDINKYLSDKGEANFATILEHLTDDRYQAIDDTNKIGATGCWFDPIFWKSFDSCASGNIDKDMIRVLDANRDFAEGKSPVTYIENHDHTTLMNKAGNRNFWWKSQPYMIGFLTCPGAPMIHNGQEFGEDYYIPEQNEPGNPRIKPRPLHWNEYSDDSIGHNLTERYQKLIELRKNHPALRSINVYPQFPADNFNDQGYGASIDKDVVIYHRWGYNAEGKLERFIIVINYSGYDQYVDIPFSSNGQWNDLLNNQADNIEGFRLNQQKINSNWGRIYYQAE